MQDKESLSSFILILSTSVSGNVLGGKTLNDLFQQFSLSFSRWSDEQFSVIVSSHILSFYEHKQGVT